MRHFFIFAGVVMATMCLQCCEEHSDIYDNSLRVGNILLDNSKVITPELYDSTKDNPVGVIFYADREATLVVGMCDLGNYAYSTELVKFKNASSSIDTMDGKASTATLVMTDYETPAADAAVAYSPGIAGWHLPSAYELRLLAFSSKEVNKSLEKIGGQPLTDEQYVSSSQDGSSEDNSIAFCYCVSLEKGLVTSSMKTVEHPVRPVMIIK